MKTLMILFTTLFLFSTVTFANDGPLIKAQYGLGFGSNGNILNSSEKNFNVGYYNKLSKVLGWDIHGGILTEGGQTSGYTFAQFGLVLHPFDWMYVDHYFGPGYVTKGNNKISGGLNFSIHIGMGWRDPNARMTVGLNWKHISNAGITQPNRGMDFWLVQVGIPI